MRKGRFEFGRLMLGVLVFASAAWATPIAIGFITFDTGAPISGENEVSINNFTGLTYGCSVANGTPVCDDLTLDTVSLTVNYLNSQSQAEQTILNVIGGIGPGSMVPINFIFPATENIISLLFSATITPTSFHLTDDSVFQADETVISDPLTPDSNTLSLLTVNAAVSSAPEPCSIAMIPMGILLTFVFVHKRTAKTH